MEHGLIIINNPDRDKPLAEIKTLQCVHCGSHFPVQPGSGKTRGFCLNCNGPVCGPSCAECVPIEKWLELMEGTRKPGQISVGWTG